MPSIPRSLVRLTSRAASCSTGSRQLQPEQRPGAAGQHRRVLVDRRRRRTPTRCRGWRPRRPARRRARGGRAAGRARCRARPAAPNRRAGRPEPLDQPVRPLARCARRAGRWSRRSCARWPARRTARGEQVGHQRDRAARPRSAAEPSSASSWKTVLIGIVWMPVTAYSRSAGTRSNARSIMPVGAVVAVVEGQAEHAVVGRRAARSRRPRCRRRRRASVARAAQPGERLGEQVQRGSSAARRAAAPAGWRSGAPPPARPARRPASRAPRGRWSRRGRRRRSSRQGGRPPRGARSPSSARSPKNAAISDCQRALTSVAAIARWAASKSSVST